MKRKETTLSMNRTVRVTLRKRGADAINRRLEKVRRIWPDTPVYKEGDTWRGQLHEMAWYFGEEMMAGLDPPFWPIMILEPEFEWRLTWWQRVRIIFRKVFCR